MKIPAAIAVLLVAASSSSLHPLDEYDWKRVACGCTFYKLDPDAPLGQVSGDEIVLLDVNADPPRALVNLGAGNTPLSPDQPIRFPLFECSAGNEFESVWLNDDIRLSMHLVVTEPGYEACWFRGEAKVSAPPLEVSEVVNGACGC